MSILSSVVINNRTYAMPKLTAIVICLDGCEPDYLEATMVAGLMPNLQRIIGNGTSRLAHSVVPSFTNPNNLSIATGCLPAVHGICGNYFYDMDSDSEVMMNNVQFLRAPTIFSAFQAAGARVAIVTAKDKLRALLGAGLAFNNGNAFCFSAECSDHTTKDVHGLDNASQWLGMAVPEVYSAKLSEFVFAAGVKLLKEFKPNIMYLTTTDFIQHKYAPDHAIAQAFYMMFDGYLGQLDALGAAIVITGDHGMKPKHLADGSPNVVYIQDVLDEWLGTAKARVILPITDPYVVHHGALGAFATVYLPADSDKEMIIARLKTLTGIEYVCGRGQACRHFGLPADRIGDIVLTSGAHFAIGTSVSRHNLAALDQPLRSHGGLQEQTVPFIVNRPLPLNSAPNLRNFDGFFYATKAAAL